MSNQKNERKQVEQKHELKNPDQKHQDNDECTFVMNRENVQCRSAVSLQFRTYNDLTRNSMESKRSKFWRFWDPSRNCHEIVYFKTCLKFRCTHQNEQVTLSIQNKFFTLNKAKNGPQQEIEFKMEDRFGFENFKSKFSVLGGTNLQNTVSVNTFYGKTPKKDAQEVCTPVLFFDEVFGGHIKIVVEFDGNAVSTTCN